MEMMVALALFGVLSIVLFLAVAQTTQVWSKVSSEQSAQFQLRRASAELQREVCMASLGESGQIGVNSVHHPGSFDGDAFWFLSPKPAAVGQPLLKVGGRPFWQCNVLYYMIVPDRVQEIAATAPMGGVDADGYEDRCAYKVLIRKVIDTGTPTDPADESTEEALLADPVRYLTAPQKYDVSAMASEPGVLSVKIVAKELLTFRASTGGAYPGEVAFDLRAVAIEDASKSSGFGQRSLSDGPFTLRNLVSVPAKN